MKRKTLLLMLVLMFISTNALSQNIIYGRITGVVQAGINVELYKTSCGIDELVDSFVTNLEGYYSFGCLDNGTYRVVPKLRRYGFDSDLNSIDIPQLVIQSYDFTSYEVYRFIVVGDSRGETYDPDGVNDVIFTEIVNAILNENPEFVLVPGDLVGGYPAAGTLDLQLDHWIEIAQPLYDEGIGVYPVRGNHELIGTKAGWDLAFSGAYALPNNGPTGEENITYSVTRDNILIVAVDQYTPWHQVNQDWLDSQLSQNKAQHIFVFGHEPAFKKYHTECLDNYPVLRDAFWNSIKLAGGKVYFSCHDHFYDHARIDDGDGNPDNDLHQFIVGTATDGLVRGDYDYDGANSFYTPVEVYHEANYGYLLVEIIGSEVTLEWKHRVAPGAYKSGGDIFSYSVN